MGSTVIQQNFSGNYVFTVCKASQKVLLPLSYSPLRLQFHNQAVVSQLDAMWQLLVHLVVQSYLVTHVGEIGAARLHQAHYVQGSLNGHVRRVLLVAQGIHHKHLNTPHQFERGFRNILCIGYISQIAYAIAIDEQFAMPHRQRSDLHTAAVERLVVNLKGVEDGRSGIRIVAKAVRHLLVEVAEHIAARKDGEMRRAVVAIRAQVVHAANVVVVGVGDDEGIEVAI